MFRDPSQCLMRDPVTMLVVAGVSGALQVKAGMDQKKAMERQADAYEEQARIAQQEADLEAERRAEERDKFIAKQKVAFLASNIGIGGSVVSALDESFRQFGFEIDAIRRQGVAQSNQLRTEASITRDKGKAALLSGIAQGVGTVASGYTTFKKTQGLKSTVKPTNQIGGGIDFEA